MTKLKVSSKFKLFTIISVVILVLGMALGTIGHFVMNGFFNYGDEFTSYKSVVIRYSAAEYTEETVKPVCKDAFAGLSGYTVSYSDATSGGEIVYKFSANANTNKLQAAADKINKELNKVESTEGDYVADLNVAYVRVGTIKEGGSKALTFASIAVASAAAFMFIYYIFRYKLRSACAALLACVHNLGLFVALIALTRIPVGAEFIAICALIVFLTMLGCGVFFDKTRKNFKSDAYAKSDRVDVIEISAAECHKTNMVAIIAFMAVAVVFGVFAAIAALNISAIFIVPLLIIGMFVCCYGTVYFTPSVFVKIDALCEKIKLALKEKKAEGKKQTAVSDKAQA